MVNHLDKFLYSDTKSFLDQTEDARALPFLIDIAPFMDEQEWLTLLNAAWPRIKNADEYQEQLRETPYGKQRIRSNKQKKADDKVRTQFG